MTQWMDTGDKESFENFLFTKGYLVNWKEEKPQDCVRTLYALAQVFGIKATRNAHLAVWSMVETAQRIIGTYVPIPFYTGFPQSVLKLTEEQRLIDQLIHYSITYGLGDFSQPGHSLLEERFERLAFREKTQIREFQMVDAKEAAALVQSYVGCMLTSTRPLNRDMELMVLSCARLYPQAITVCNCKDTAIRLLYELKDIRYARFLQLPDVIKLADEISQQRGLPPRKDVSPRRKDPEILAKYQGRYAAFSRGGKKIRKDLRNLNLRNQDRKLIAAVIDFFFEGEQPNVRDCYEKRALWAGLLHHIHYEPKNTAAADFVQAMRGEGENKSVYSASEAAMDVGDVKKAAEVLARGKGSGAVGRNLNYLLSRSKDPSDIPAVLSHLGNLNLILLIQMILQYRHYSTDGRTFKFVRHHRMTTHWENAAEIKARRSVLPEATREALEAHLEKLLKAKLAEKAIGKVYVEAGMEKCALPLQEATGESGLGVLPRGSRIRIGEGNKLRCFTYWEKANDVDLACFALEEEGTDQLEFSWRSMYSKQDACVTFSGDETSGYEGGSEYYDIVLPAFQEKYPGWRYIVFTNNVFSGEDFDTFRCTAGYMIREEQDSGEIFEPKTVQSAFRITGNCTFAALFALDLKEREMVWLNLAMDSEDAVAGENEIALMRDWLDATDTINLASFFRGMATEIAEKPEDADLIVADHYKGELREGQTLIRSCDYEKIFAYLK